MALNLAVASTSLPSTSLRTLIFVSKNRIGALCNKPTSIEKQLSPCRAAQSEGITEDPGVTGYESDGSSPRPTIRDQLSQLSGDTYGEFSLPLGKKLKASMNNLTISQKRNIKRQAYLDEVSQRNDSVFFATIGAFVILPPLIILAVAVLTGYVQLLP
ncbi:hypothetical protein CKAN_01814800 [Cinnamomum micranthum f. kanehirae]|uniref:Uncharacterized protein n=1 Tax=Cinnamomum micranthum f. kanehirae TaxID=337451 RepID=A0A3S3PER5_9MAGN|nr:hypothetical protein CKAN_01814800 [Cinnamomum micranthum f. kanehirae]